MNKTKIEWADYTSNPVKGYCPNACPYCYARAMYDRFGWDKTIRFTPGTLADISVAKPGSRIFVGSTIDLFGSWVKPEWMARILREGVEHYPDRTFIFLTKFPERLVRWNPWPENAWVGVTHDGTKGSLRWDTDRLRDVQATIKFVSFEPLLRPIYGLQFLPQLNWVIIGAQTGGDPKPPLSDVHRWAQEIIDAANAAGTPVFLKDNLHWPVQRRDWPDGRVKC